MKTGICGMRFKDGASDEKIMNAITSIYSNNKDVIDGMEWNEFREDLDYKKVMKYIKEL